MNKENTKKKCVQKNGSLKKHLERKMAEEELTKAKEELKDKKELELQAWGLSKANDAIKLLYKEIEVANKKLHELDQLKTDFISTVSHELRTPLSTIKEGISLVLDGIPGQINKEQEDILFTIKNNIDRLARTINELLDISKIESGKLELKNEPLDIIAVTKSIVSEFEPRAKEKRLELRTNFSPKKIELYGDQDKIIEIFTNLIGNALKFTEKGFIEISVKEHEHEVECVVLDTGIGISEENMTKVFDKFQQFGRTPGSGDKGTGLGLSIVKGLVEAHKGQIRVESELGKGIKFVFTLSKGNKGES